MKPNLKRTENTFADNPVPLRAYQTRRDMDNVKNPSITLEDINDSISYYLKEVIAASYESGGRKITIPVEYALPEKWKAIQENGNIRGKDGKLQLPYIAFRRTSTSKNVDLSHNKLTRNFGNEYSFKAPYTKVNRYDRFDLLNNRVPVQEFYSISVPDYITVQYDLVALSNNTDDIDTIAELLHYHSGKFWGDTNKFLVFVDNFNFDSSNNFQEDRIQKCTTQLTIHAYLIPPDDGKNSNIQRQLSKAQIRFEAEFEQGQPRKETISTGTGRTVNKIISPDLYDGGLV